MVMAMPFAQVGGFEGICSTVGSYLGDAFGHLSTVAFAAAKGAVRGAIGAGAVLFAGSCATGATTAAFAHNMYNKWEGQPDPRSWDESSGYCDDLCQRVGPVGPIAAGVALTGGVAVAGYATVAGSAGLLTGIGIAISKTRSMWRNVNVDGPGKGLKYANGRIIQIRYRKLPIFRMDFHPIPGSRGASRLHIHVGRDMTRHRSINPRGFFDK